MGEELAWLVVKQTVINSRSTVCKAIDFESR